MQREQIRNEVHDFILKNFIYSDKTKLGDDESLLGSGVIDSTGILELITFLESKFAVKFADNELVADNFDSVTRIISVILRKVAVD